MKERNLLISQLKNEKLVFIPEVSFDSIREDINKLEKKTQYLEAALEKEREINVDERYEEEITYLHKQLSYCPFKFNEEQYSKYSTFLKNHSKCGHTDDFDYTIHFTPTSLGMAADLVCKRCGDWIELIGSEDW